MSIKDRPQPNDIEVCIKRKWNSKTRGYLVLTVHCFHEDGTVYSSSRAIDAGDKERHAHMKYAFERACAEIQDECNFYFDPAVQGYDLLEEVRLMLDV